MVKPDGLKEESSSADPEQVAAPQFRHLFKVVILGDSGTGKTALLRRFNEDSFQESYLMTIGVDFAVKTVTIPNGDHIKLQLWDTAGQERYRNITTSYYRGAHAAFIVYDITSKESHDNVKLWVQEVKRYASEDIVVMVVGTKLDLKEKSPAAYFAEEGTADADPGLEDVEAFHYVSSKTGENVDRAFRSMVDTLVSRKLEHSSALRGAAKKIGRKGKTISLQSTVDKPKKKCF